MACAVQLLSDTMKRRNAERDISEELASSKSQRIVRRKDRQSPSPEAPRRRDVRSTTLFLDNFTAEDKYGDDKYTVPELSLKSEKSFSQDKYAKLDAKPYGKYDERGGGRDKYEHRPQSHSRMNSSGDSRLGRKSDLGDKYLESRKPRQLSQGHYDRSNSEHGHTHSVGGGGGNQRYKESQTMPPRFDYALRLGNLDFKIPDGELKTVLFREFKRYGYINVKVIGYGRERHAFVNFTCEDDARRAHRDKPEITIEDRSLLVEWAKSTLCKFPHLNSSSVSSPSSSLPKKRSYASDDTYTDYSRNRDKTDRYSGSGGHSGGTSAGSASRTTRDVSYRNSTSKRQSQTFSPPSTSRQFSSSTHSPQVSSSSNAATPSHHDSKHVVPVIDPSATRTLFVGNLEQDITERELRDLFGPYGRIESVDIKLQRSTATAYAFIKFVTINDAINAKNDMHGRQYGEFRLKIGFGRGSPSAKVWIGNITDNNDVAEIRTELDRFGLIRRVDYASGDNHAFIHFDSFDAAQAAVTSLVGYRFHSSGRPIKIDMSRPAHARAEWEEAEADHQRSSSHERKPFSRVSSSGDAAPDYRRKVRDHGSHHYSANGNHDTSASSGHTGAGGGFASKGGSSRIVSESDRGDRSHSFDRGNTGAGVRDKDRGGSRFKGEGGRKRPHSPVGGGGNQYGGGGYRGHHDGDSEYRAKRPCNGLDHSRNGHHIGRGASSRSGGGGGRKERTEHMDTLEPRGGKDRERGRTRSSGGRAGQEGKGDGAKLSGDELSGVQNDTITAPADPLATDTALKLEDSSLAMSADGTSKSVLPDSATPENLADMAKLFPVAWAGSLVLKNTGFPTRMHLIGGDPAVAKALLHSRDGKGDLGELRITQRLRLEPPRLEEVNKRMSSAGPSGHCILLALPGPTPSQSASPENQPLDEAMQLRPLRSLVSYLKQKEAAGIVAISTSDAPVPEGGSDKDSSCKDVIGVLHAFPPCDFSQGQLLKVAPNLGQDPSKEDHIVVLLVKGTV